MPEATGSTDLAGALRFLRQYRPETLVVVSDGEPNDQQAALTAAVALNCKISTVFVGDERSDGAKFLAKLRLFGRGAARWARRRC
jgi:hypothetical protein